MQVGDESYESYVAERDGILSSLARRAKVGSKYSLTIVPSFPLIRDMLMYNLAKLSIHIYNPDSLQILNFLKPSKVEAVRSTPSCRQIYPIFAILLI